MMIQNPVSKRRKEIRAEVYWPVTVVSRQSVLQGRITNISRGGALLYLEEQIDLSENIRLAIEIPKYNYVISTRGKVVRSVSLDKNVKQFIYSAGVKFTEISNEDLKFFTGNLAPEWQKNFKEPEKPGLLRYNLMRNIGYGLSTIAICSLIFCVILIYRGDEVDSGQIDALEGGLENLELQVKTFQDVIASNKTLAEQLRKTQDELSDTKSNNHEMLAKIGQLQAQINENQEKDVNRSHVSSSEPAEIPKTDLDKEETLPTGAVYHVVRNGENLYRIALEHELKVNEIMKLNHFSDNAVIHPNQKLLIR